MLILSRFPEESIVLRGVTEVADRVEVKIIGVKGNKVRLGITAPRTVIVDREEIDRQKRGESQ